jgi:CRISPR-associated endonuclease/helicase Cas3
MLGHHTGLSHGGTAATSLEQFLDERPEALGQMEEYLRNFQIHLPQLKLRQLSAHRAEMWIRMVHSGLVDADHLDTEEHLDPRKPDLRKKSRLTVDTLWFRLNRSQKDLLAKASDTKVNRVRREVYEQCLGAAEGQQGVYRLTVPTGGGKTRSGLAFALKHAVKHGLQRVVVAIPYTSIIDQTVDVYRKILGREAVLEHHSQVVAKEDEDQDINARRLQLATENWDAPLIVTTTVQLFESLFSNRPAKVRKLHNLAQSVLLLDEVQALPPELLEPTLDALRVLVEDYRVTVVLSTATQPAFESTPYLDSFHSMELREIVPNYPGHFDELRRVEYVHHPKPLTWEDLADRIRNRPQVMVVLNTRRDALRLLDALGKDPDAFHLSTLLCAAHRRRVLGEVRRRLAPPGGPVRLISTQVVEAGVDIDFPEVWRAIGPLDRVVQVAGRCNREGERELGRMNLFEPAEGSIPRGSYKVGLEKARLVLHRHSSEALHRPHIYSEYFRELFSSVDTDKQGIQALREQLDYPEVAARYRIIDSQTVAVVVPYGGGFRWLERWKRHPDRETWRRMQPYLVNLYLWEAQRLEKDGRLEKVSEDTYQWQGLYHERRGLIEAGYDTADLII